MTYFPWLLQRIDIGCKMAHERMSLLNIVQLIQVNQAPLIVAKTVHLINQQKLAPLFT